MSKAKNSFERQGTAKELDEETGLYYYGARYLDPKYSRWISADPALSDYMAGSSAGCGGIYNHINLNLYHYGGNNPIYYIDPDGRKIRNFAFFYKQTSIFNRSLLMGKTPNGKFDTEGNLIQPNTIGAVGCKFITLLNIANNINYEKNGGKFDEYVQPALAANYCRNDKYFINPYPTSKQTEEYYETDAKMGDMESLALLQDITKNTNMSISRCSGADMVKSMVLFYSKTKEKVSLLARVKTPYGEHFIGLGWDKNSHSLIIYDPTDWGPTTKEYIQKQVSEYNFELIIVRDVKYGKVE